jgi:hypothetical protein
VVTHGGGDRGAGGHRLFDASGFVCDDFAALIRASVLAVGVSLDKPETIRRAALLLSMTKVVRLAPCPSIRLHTKTRPNSRSCGTFEASVFSARLSRCGVGRQIAVTDATQPITDGVQFDFYDLAIAAADRRSRPLPNVNASRSIVVSSMSSAAVRRNSAFSERRTSSSFDGYSLLRAGAGPMCLEYLMKSTPEIPLT